MKSIQTKITALLLLSVIVASATIGVIAMLTVSNTLQKKAEENLGLICDLNTRKLDAIFESVEMSTSIIATVASDVLYDVSSLSDRVAVQQYVSDVSKKTLGVIMNGTQDISGVYFCTNPALTGKAEGFFWSSHQNDGQLYEHSIDELIFDKDADLSIDDYFKDIDSRNGGNWSESIYNPTVGAYLNSYTIPIIKGNVYVGEIGMCVSSDNIRAILDETRVYKSGFAAVLDSDGVVLYHPEHSHGEKLTIVADNSMQLSEIVSMNRQSDKLISYKSNKQSRRMVFSALRNGMRLCIVAPENEIFEEHSILVIRIIFLIVIILIGVFIALYFFSRRLTRPILQLNAATREMTLGNLDREIVSISNDEIGELAASFNEARIKLKGYIDDLRDAALCDGLTGVNNKIAFTKTQERLDALIQEGYHNFSVAVFDINNLKITNDILGYQAGDELLITVAKHLADNFGSKSVYRIGGDEFAVVDEASVASSELFENVVDKLNAITLASYPTVRISCAYGVSDFDDRIDKSFSDVVIRADRQMYNNKSDTHKEQKNDKFHKSTKELSIGKYIEFLSILNQSTEDYLFLFDIESDKTWFFGDVASRFDICNNPESTATFSEVCSIIHNKEKSEFKHQIMQIISAKQTELNINHRWIDKNGNSVWINMRGKVICDEIGKPFIMIGRASANELRSFYNPLTGLLNSSKFSRDFQNGTTREFSHILLLNIDDLSATNLKYGRARGDEYICLLAGTLDELFALDCVYHMEQDKFLILLNSDSDKDIEELFEVILNSTDGSFSVSAAVVPNDQNLRGDKYSMYEYARLLLKEKRPNGFGKIWFFSSEEHRKTLSDAELFEELEHSVYNGCNGFYLCYQPKVNANGYQLKGAEALLRYNSPNKRTVYPDVFIPILEQSGLINEVGIWVLSTALRQCKEWRRYNPDFRISVNFSSVQFRSETIVERVLGLLKTYGLPGEALIIEVTESIKLEESDVIFSMFEAFRNAGISISIDDFGTGYSNLSYLKKLHADEIKIDRVFISDIKDTTYNYRVVKNIIEFAKSNSLSVCLEGVENSDELAVIAGLGADTLQGYLFSKPLSQNEFEVCYLNAQSEKYKEKCEQLNELIDHTKKMQRIHVDTKEILSKLETGLWVMKVNTTTNKGELFFDATMRRQMGVKENDNANQCFDFWYSRISADFQKRILELFRHTYESGSTMTMEYVWTHPQKGEVVGRFTVKCAESDENTVLFEGFHRIISDVVDFVPSN